MQQAIDWAGIRANAVTLGIRGSARAAAVQLPPDEQKRFVARVLKRAEREGWKAATDAVLARTGAVPLAPVTRSAAPVSASSNVVTAADSMANRLADDSRATRLAGATYARRTLEHAAQLDPDDALQQAQNVKAVVASAALVHAWEAKAAAPQIMVNLALLGVAPESVPYVDVQSSTVPVPGDAAI
jgi:cell division septum initiation protein DivIVA